ncbi:hypothetical protein AncyloWKF20_06775 [Ancylobacter sp. WKF20]|uniref:hypothetical protein n=1 Tax=Ancylobacter sp. WKF20 TaxID=3039801 RepID=UPI0024342C0F|nr:hypothetical protein [Ancylobacter sp. WKF20]WGD31523.1 hypothetical protein AncyloWKF20_06775 [Ancylobacter sp. WKF20]
MQRLLGARAAIILVALLAPGLPALAQTSTSPGNRYVPQRPDSVRPNSQNLMQGPSYWTPQQRRLNVPGATSNPSLRRDTGAYPPQPLPPPPRPAETPPKTGG